MAAGRRPKTLEWHQTALPLFQQYLVTERHLCFPSQITAPEVRGWLAFLRSTPSVAGTLLSVSSIGTYARSARAFCHWLVRQGHLEHSPFAGVPIPNARKTLFRLLEPEEFEQLLQACRPLGEISSVVDRVLSTYLSKRKILMSYKEKSPGRP